MKVKNAKLGNIFHSEVTTAPSTNKSSEIKSCDEKCLYIFDQVNTLSKVFSFCPPQQNIKAFRIQMHILLQRAEGENAPIF